MTPRVVVLALFALFVGTVALGVANSAADLIDREARHRTEAHNIEMDRQRLALEGERERQRLELEAAAAAVARDRAQAEAVAPVATFAAMALATVPLLATAALIGAALMALDYYRMRRAPLVLVNADAPPLPRAMLATDPRAALTMIDQRHQRRMLVAQHAPPQPVPHSWHYAPHVTIKNDARPALPADAGETVVTVPSFAQLVASGEIGPGRPLVLGYTDSGPLVGDWGDLYSSAVAGSTGSGKTTTTRFLVSQSVMSAPDTRFLVLDPHGLAGPESLAGTLAPLSSAFLDDPATDERAMLRLVRMATRELDQRLEGKAGPPWVLLCDEFTALMRGELAAPLATLIERIAQEGRKVQLYALLLGQIWKGDRAGGTSLRDSLASAYVHRIKRAQARFLLPTDDAPRAERLPTGAALLYRTTGEVVTVTIPNTTAADVRRAAGEIVDSTARFRAPSRPFPAASAPLPPASDGSGGGEDEKRTGSGEEADPEADQVLHLLRNGTSQSQIIKEVWGASGGRAYTDAAARITEIIAANLRDA